MPSARPTNFMILIYRMAAQPTANRVYVWRMLKKVGAVYLQQSVTVFPQDKAVWRELQPILEKITASSGEYHMLPLRQLPPVEKDKLVEQFVDQTSRHYEEIVENCEVNFSKEIEFETFRRNFTYEEAEEIRAEYDKITTWFERVEARDWFGAPNRDAAAEWLRKCQKMLEDFEAQVYRAQGQDGLGSGVPRRTTRSRTLHHPTPKAGLAPAPMPVRGRGVADFLDDEAGA